MGRALADGVIEHFRDPTALVLLPEDARARVAKIREGRPPASIGERLRRFELQQLALVMAARTLEIDGAVRASGHPQVVILGAGLDGRAWRMPELRESVVFEVDHPDSQRDKRARSATLDRQAREVRFVPVDFEKDDLDEALEGAGHDPQKPTTWIWEGVVMYLAARDIEATLAVIARRSAATSRLIIVYHSPALLLRVIGLGLKRLGEPLRSAHTAEEMRALLVKYGFRVARDEALPAIGAVLGDSIARSTKRMKHMRVVTADQPPAM
jgi:methyltransferase (TIGR00027 family)